MSYLSAIGQINSVVATYDTAVIASTASGTFADLYTTPVLPAGAYLVGITTTIVGVGVTSSTIRFTINGDLYAGTTAGGAGSLISLNAPVISDGLYPLKVQLTGIGANWTSPTSVLNVVRLP